MTSDREPHQQAMDDIEGLAEALYGDWRGPRYEKLTPRQREGWRSRATSILSSEWLARVKREAALDGWEEGYSRGIEDGANAWRLGSVPRSTNPHEYRKETT